MSHQPRGRHTIRGHVCTGKRYFIPWTCNCCKFFRTSSNAQSNTILQPTFNVNYTNDLCVRPQIQLGPSVGSKAGMSSEHLLSERYCVPPCGTTVSLTHVCCVSVRRGFGASWADRWGGAAWRTRGTLHTRVCAIPAYPLSKSFGCSLKLAAADARKRTSGVKASTYDYLYRAPQLILAHGTARAHELSHVDQSYGRDASMPSRAGGQPVSYLP